MSLPVTISTYQHNDLMPVIALLMEALPLEPMSPELFARKVLLDPNFNPNGAFVARSANGLLGFLLTIARKQPLEDAPPDSERGWITLFAVAPTARQRGIGTALLHAAETWLRQQQRTEAWISPYAPNYWTPGVDENACATGLAFLHRRGYTTIYRPLSMDVSLVGWQQPAWVNQRMAEINGQGLALSYFFPAHAGQVSDFLRAEFPGDWQRYVRETMLDITNGTRPKEELRLLFAGNRASGRVIGFAQSEGERFGPFGIAREWRGKGLGAALLYETLDGMRRRGLHNAWFLWTDDRTAERLYKPAGFRETRRYAVLKKML